MSLFIDSHVHVYPSFDIDSLFAEFRRRTKKHGASAGAMMLAERHGADVFGDLKAGAITPAGSTLARAEDRALLFKFADGGPDVAVVAGRQIACAERIEVLSLGVREAVKDGTPLVETIDDSLARDALAVLAWGVGKWMFSRERTVRSLFRRFAPDQLLIGDSSLRPVFWMEPSAMAEARTLGRRVIHGSDPLPRAFEQTRAGCYGDLADSDLDSSSPVLPQILAALRESGLTTVGRRAGPLQFVRRMI